MTSWVFDVEKQCSHFEGKYFYKLMWEVSGVLFVNILLCG